MKFTKSQFVTKLPVIALSAGLALTSGVALAQREAPTRQENRAERRQQIQNMTPEQRTEYFQKRIQERMANMTPEQRVQFETFRAQAQVFQRQAQVAQVSVVDRQRYLMTSAGIEDATVQDAILEYSKALVKERETVAKAATDLRVLIGDKDATTEAITEQTEKLTTASTDFRVWKEGALKDLDEKINYSTDARLKAFLILTNVIGDESNDAGGYAMIFPKDVAGSGDIIDLLPKTEGNNGGWGGGGMGGINRGGRAGGEQRAPVADIPMAAPAN